MDHITDYKFINCQGKEFSEAEYNNLKQELRERVSMSTTQGYTITSILLVYFAAIFTFIIGLSNFIVNNDNTIFGKYLWLDTFVVLAVMLFCCLPVALMYVFSSKFFDHIRGISSLAMYCRVFYEFPSFISVANTADIGAENTSSDKKEKIKALGWELMHCDTYVPQASRMLGELFIICIISIVLSFVVGAVLITSMIAFGAFNGRWTLDYVGVAFVFLCMALMEAFFIKLTCIVHKNTDTDTLFKVYLKVYFDEYCRKALDIKLLSKVQIDELKAYNAEQFKCDKELVGIIKDRQDEVKKEKKEERKQRKITKNACNISLNFILNFRS